jgi:hypothetical protein
VETSGYQFAAGGLNGTQLVPAFARPNDRNIHLKFRGLRDVRNVIEQNGFPRNFWRKSDAKSLVTQRGHGIDARCPVRRRVGTQERGAQENGRGGQQRGWIVTLDSV